MRIEFRATVEQGVNQSLCVVIDRRQALYGSLMRVSMRVSGDKTWYKVMPSDLTTRLIVPLPPNLILERKLQSGQVIEGEIEVKEYTELSIPDDVIEALGQQKIDISCVATRQQRQGLLFIKEANTNSIRQQRIAKFVEACKKYVERLEGQL